MTPQLTSRGVVRAGTYGAAVLGSEFAERCCVRVPQFIAPPLLARVQRAIHEAVFAERAHGTIATELCMARNVCLGLLHFLVNDPQVFDFVERVTGRADLRNFSGRVYRRLPGGAHYDSWHTDVHRDRAVGMSVNLSGDRYEGGVFEIRDEDSDVLRGSIANVGPGDAILFLIGEGLEHRVTDVTGSAPKTAFAGWFGSTRDYLAELRRDRCLRDEA